jgi:bifunctional DNA-binding transcriptional regulator/antitoxin component of YhaV-PrlF toxin-antitoxin module
MERKLCEINGSLVVTIPKQICDLYKMKNGDILEIEPIGIGELKIRKKIHNDHNWTSKKPK